MDRSDLYRSLRRAMPALALWAACTLPAAQAQQRYDRIAITQPRDGATVFSNTGHVAVGIRISPAPDLARGDRVELLLDGDRTAQAQGEQFTLDGVDRGEHRLRARIVGRDGDTMLESAPVTFYLWHASRRFPSRH